MDGGAERRIGDDHPVVMNWKMEREKMEIGKKISKNVNRISPINLS